MSACSRKSWLILSTGLMVLWGSSLAWAQAYPVKKSANGRYLVDQNNTPFLIAGDAPQSLTVNLSTTDAGTYFADRAAHAFNSVWINLICTTYTAGRADGSTFDGILPFTGFLSGGSTLDFYDLSKPNEAFFSRCDQMITAAANNGLLVFLDPAETGGWLNCLLNNGPTACRAYGQFLGNRYANFKNIVWMSGNDFQGWSTASNDAVVTAVALGIKDKDPNHLHTVELDYDVSASTDDPHWVPIIGLNAAYTYFPTYAEVLSAYNVANGPPVFMVEANYEFENNTGGPSVTNAWVLRMQEYWTNLSGATGQIYGNHYTWTLPSDWASHLDTPGALQMPYLQSLFTSRAWYNLVPDQNHSVLTAGYGIFSSSGQVSTNDYATAARTPDGTLVMAYLPTQRTVTVALTQLSGMVTARWYDPSNGTFTAIAGSPFSNTGAQNFTPPGTNSEGSPDWVLVLEATAGSPKAPSIATQPSSQTVTAGTAATFSVVASGTAPLSYQWQEMTSGASTWTNVGTNAPSYTTAAAALTDTGAGFRVIISNAAGSVTSAVATLTVNPSGGGGGSSQGPVAIDSGGGAVGSFVADVDFTGGSTASTTVAIDTSAVANPAPQGVYQSERWGAFTYVIPGLKAGAAYTVRLHFAEIYFSAAGQRVFDVSINGTPVLTNFDIFAVAGAANKAVIQEYNATADGSGQITIDYAQGPANWPKSSGLEVIAGGTGGAGGGSGGTGSGGSGGGAGSGGGGSGGGHSKCGLLGVELIVPGGVLWALRRRRRRRFRGNGSLSPSRGSTL